MALREFLSESEQGEIDAACTQAFSHSCFDIRRIGLEMEYPLVRDDGSTIQLDVLEYLWEELERSGWNLQQDMALGTFCGASFPSQLPGSKPDERDVVTTDFGYPTLEVSLAPAIRLDHAQTRLSAILQTLTEILGSHDVRLLGYGIQPVVEPSASLLGPKDRYHLIWHACAQENAADGSNLPGAELHCISASQQSQIDVSRSEAVEILNAFLCTSALRAVLCANSPIWRSRIGAAKVQRLSFWTEFWPARSEQVGIPDLFDDTNVFVARLLQFRPIVLFRDNRGFRLDSRQEPLHRLKSSEVGWSGHDIFGNKQCLEWALSDIYTQNGFAWFDARLQLRLGTIEDRVCCQQPPEEHLGAVALALGLVENYREHTKIASSLSLSDWRNLREFALRDGMLLVEREPRIEELLQQLLNCAEVGLQRRGFGEERFLSSLVRRFKRKMAPADVAIQNYQDGGVKQLVAKLNMTAFLEG